MRNNTCFNSISRKVKTCLITRVKVNYNTLYLHIAQKVSYYSTARTETNNLNLKSTQVTILIGEADVCF